MALWRLTSSAVISTLVMNGYGLLLEKHRLIESVTLPNRRYSCFLLIWGATEFYVIKRLLKGSTCNARFSIDEVLPEIASWREGQYGTSNRQVIVQADNAPPRTARSTLRCIESYKMVRLPHSPYSPDLVPSDFLDSVISKASSMDRILRLEMIFWSGQSS
jgi:hypothetical protein